jgi:hypothetical protein
MVNDGGSIGASDERNEALYSSTIRWSEIATDLSVEANIIEK